MDTKDMVCLSRIKDKNGVFYIFKFQDPDESLVACDHPKRLRFSTSFRINKSEYFVFKPKKNKD